MRVCQICGVEVYHCSRCIDPQTGEIGTIHHTPNQTPEQEELTYRCVKNGGPK